MRRALDVAKHIVVGAQVRGGKVLREAMPALAARRPRAVLERDRGVPGEDRMHVMIERKAHFPCQAISAIANSPPETMLWPPRSTGIGAAAAARVNAARCGSAIAAASKTSEVK